MNMRSRWKMLSSGAFCSTFWPSSVVTENLPAAALTHPGGDEPSAYESNVSVHGSGCTMRARASPLVAPAAALMVPACATGSAATVNVPSATVPFSPCSDHVAAVSSRRNRPFASKSLACSLTVCPGFSTISVGVTCTYAGAPSPFSAGASTAHPVVVFTALGPMAYTASLDTKKIRPRETAAPPSTGSGVPSSCCALFVLIGSWTSLSTSALSACGRRMKNFPLSVPT